MFVKIVDLNSQLFDSYAILPLQVYARTSFVFDYGCDSYLEILDKVSITTQTGFRTVVNSIV